MAKKSPTLAARTSETCRITSRREVAQDKKEHQEYTKRYQTNRNKIINGSTLKRKKILESLSKKYGANINGEKVKKAEKYLKRLQKCDPTFENKKVYQVTGYTPYTLGAMLKRKNASKIAIYKPGQKNPTIYRKANNGEFYSDKGKRALVVGKETVVILNNTLITRFSGRKLLKIRRYAKNKDTDTVDHLANVCFETTKESIKIGTKKIKITGHKFIATGPYYNVTLGEVLSLFKKVWIKKAGKNEFIALTKGKDGEFYAKGSKKRMKVDRNDTVYTAEDLKPLQTAATKNALEGTGIMADFMSSTPTAKAAPTKPTTTPKKAAPAPRGRGRTTSVTPKSTPTTPTAPKTKPRKKPANFRKKIQQAIQNAKYNIKNYATNNNYPSWAITEAKKALTIDEKKKILTRKVKNELRQIIQQATAIIKFREKSKEYNQLPENDKKHASLHPWFKENHEKYFIHLPENEQVQWLLIETYCYIIKLNNTKKINIRKATPEINKYIEEMEKVSSNTTIQQRIKFLKKYKKDYLTK